MAASSAQECTTPTIDVRGLLNGSRHRHDCSVLHRVCLFNDTILPAVAGGRAERKAQALAKSMRVRSMYGSHQVNPLEFWHPMRAPEPGGLGAMLIKRASFSPCVPLLWVPVWAFSFAEVFINSVVPLHELLEAGLVDEHVLLRPDLHTRPFGKYKFYEMVAALSRERSTTLREAATRCRGRAAERAARGDVRWPCEPRCYQRLVFCNFKSTFDQYAPPMAPWSAAQRVARRLLPRPPPPLPVAAVAARRVLFVNRTGTKFSRSLVNLRQLVEQCSRRGGGAGGAGGAGGVVAREGCEAHEFGRRGVAVDAAAAQRAGVLVGTHGAGLVYGFFLPRGGSLVEVRPYRFEGKWPDRYFRDLSALEASPLYFQVSSGSPALSVPPPKPDVSVWDARDHGVRLPWRALREVLAKVAWCAGSAEKHAQLVAGGRNVVVSQPSRHQQQT